MSAAMQMFPCFARSNGADDGNGLQQMGYPTAEGGGTDGLVAVRACRSLTATTSFLETEHTSLQEAAEDLVRGCSKALSAKATLFSASTTRGRQAVISGLKRSSDFAVIASSDAGYAEGSVPPQEQETTLQLALESGSAVSSFAAAITVQSSLGTEGVLLIDRASSPAVEDQALLQLLKLFAKMLAERLTRLQQEQELRHLHEALAATLETARSLANLGDEDGYKKVNQLSAKMTSPQLLSGGSTAERAVLWLLNHDADEAVINNSGQVDGTRHPLGESIVGRSTAKFGSRIFAIPDVTSDADFSSIAYDEDFNLGQPAGSIIYVPIITEEELPGSELPELSQVVSWAWSRSDKVSSSISHFDILDAEALQNSALSTNLQLREAFLGLAAAERSRQGLRLISSRLARAESVLEVTHIVETEVAGAMSCEQCSFFFFHERSDELWCPPRDTLPQGICLKMGVGLVGHVAARARENPDCETSGVVTTNDPASCPQWKGDVKGFVTRNMMTAPVWSSGGDRRILGCIQVLNKNINARRRMSMQGGIKRPEKRYGFGRSDEQLLAVLATGVGEHMQRLLLDALRVKFKMDEGRNTKGDLNLMDEYYLHTRSVVQTVYPLAAELPPSTRRSTSRSSSPPPPEINVGAVRFSLDQPMPENGDVRNWYVDYWGLSPDNEFRFVADTFRECGIDDDIVSLQTLHSFVGKVRESYRDVPYHNFKHGLSVAHYSSKLAHEAGIRANDMHPADWFALIAAALCHDVDHRGRNNPFEIMSRSELAVRYNDNSPLENHHCATTFQIAFAGEGECDIFQALDQETYKRVRMLMIAGILSTDMKQHGEHVKLMKNFRYTEGASNDGQTQFLVETFLHAADISNPFMPPVNAVRWSTAVFTEFSLQVEDERRLGIPVTGFMDGLHTPLAKAKAQGGFMDFVVFPLLDSVCIGFPNLHEPRKYFEANRAATRAIVEESTAPPPK